MNYSYWSRWAPFLNTNTWLKHQIACQKWRNIFWIYVLLTYGTRRQRFAVSRFAPHLDPGLIWWGDLFQEAIFRAPNTSDWLERVRHLQQAARDGVPTSGMISANLSKWILSLSLSLSLSLFLSPSFSVYWCFVGLKLILKQIRISLFNQVSPF